MADDPIKNQNTEGLGTVEDYFTIDAEDSDLIQMIEKNITKASGEYEKFKKEGKRNEQYWMADQLKGISLRWHNSRIITNVIYTGVETMVPIITSKPAQPVISVAGEEEESEDTRKFTELLEKMLLHKYNSEDYPQQELYEMVARHLLLYKLGAIKIVWYEDIDDYLIEFVHPHKLILSSDGHYNHDIWASQYLEKTVKEIIDEFPEKQNEVLQSLFPGASGDILKQFGGTQVGFWEYWKEDGEYLVWKMQNIILQKKLNPYLKWSDNKEFDYENNHFDYPHKPLMFLNSQNLGRNIWDDTSPVSQVITIQDGINMLQRIITDTSLDQGILVGAVEQISRDELYKYTGAPNHKLSVKGSDPSRALYRVPPKQLQTFVQENIQHLLAMADNIMGTHATTRGQRSGAQTLGQDMLYKESDYGRIDAIVRGIERLSSEVYNWEVQMMMTKYKEEHYQRVLGKEKGTTLFNMMKEYNKRGIKIVVKPGSTLPTDKVSQRQEALDLAKLNRISDIDLFKRMDFPNPMDMAKNIYMQNSAPELLYPDLAAKIKANKPEVVAPPMGPPMVPPTGLGGAEALPPVPTPGVPQDQPMIPPQAEVAPPLPNVPPVQEELLQAPIVPPTQPAPLPGMPPDQGNIPIPGATEHTKAIIDGQPVAPFEGIEPQFHEEHLIQEFGFVAGDEFLKLPHEIQVAYAEHVNAEKDILQGNRQNI